MQVSEKTPEISIIVPVYNAEIFLKECVESVMTQSFTDWELLLVDDGSTDGSNAVCRRYSESDNRIKLIIKDNGGVSSARNEGLERAVGNYLFFLDADDELFPNTLSALHTIAEAERVEIVIGRSVNSQSKPGGNGPRGKVKIIDSYKVCRDMLYRKPYPDTSVCGRLMRRTLFEDLRFYPGRYEDLEIFHKLLMRTRRIALTADTVYFYRNNPSSFVNKWTESRRDAVKVTRAIINHYSHDSVMRKAAVNRYFRANYNLLLALLRHCPDDKAAISECFGNIKALRREVLADPRSRLKTRMGALVSCLGLPFISRLAGK